MKSVFAGTHMINGFAIHNNNEQTTGIKADIYKSQG